MTRYINLAARASRLFVNMTTKTSRPRGRPRRFEPDEAVATARRLFHARGYDAVGVADVTEALGINPPSFYAAFGNKAGLYARVLDHWAIHGAIPLDDILRPDRAVVTSLASLLEEAARRYAADPEAAGCLVLEGARCVDHDAREATRAFSRAAESAIRAYVAARHPDEAERVTDFVVTTMSGLSAKARDGHPLDKLLASAHLAALALAQILPA
jgi:TetR/AcrR family transcriptional repressor for divergent bdcA